ncbi:MAG: AMP-binding protein [Pseudomonadota bacterium]
MSTHALSIYSIFQANARHRPDEPAMADQDRVYTFSQVLSQVNHLAGGLLDLGIQRRDTIAILSLNRWEYLLLYGAAAAIGAITVPINWRLSHEEMRYILEDSGASHLFFDRANADAVQAMGSLNCRSVAFDSQAKGPGPDWTSILTAPVRNLPLPESQDLFCLIYTAAVAGRPRGAALSHANILASNVQTALTMGLSPGDVNLNMLPLCHITGINLAFTVMHLGGLNAIMPKFDAPKALELIIKHGVTLLGSFPPILSMIMTETKRLKTADLPLKNVIGIDSTETISQFCRETGARFWVLYGQSETSGFVTLSDSSLCPGSAGRTGCLSWSAILDSDDTPMQPGRTGEIGVRGPLVFQGYWKHGSLDTSSFRNGWHHTGDLGEMDDKGYLWFKGRKPEKELIKPGGENVYPAEVEAAILEHPDILETCVIGVPDPKFGEGIKAVCVKRPESTLTGPLLIEFVGSRIARYKKPGYVTFIETLPKNNDGTIDRAGVKKHHSA